MILICIMQPYTEDKVVISISSPRCDNEFRLMELDDLIKKVIKSASIEKIGIDNGLNFKTNPINLNNKVFSVFDSGPYPILCKHCFTNNIENGKRIIGRIIHCNNPSPCLISVTDNKLYCDYKSYGNTPTGNPNNSLIIYYMFRDVIYWLDNSWPLDLYLHDECGLPIFQIHIDGKK